MSRIGALPRASLRGFHPFWFWNGWIDEAGISEQIRLMAEQGIRGFFIHPRQGMDVPYLSPRFFSLVDHARQEAQDRGMQVHLYDEYPYPSGVAGGRVTLGNPHFHATRLVRRVYPVEPQTEPQLLVLPAGHVLNATVVPLRGGEPDWAAERNVLDRLGVHLTRQTYNEAMGLTRYSRKRFFEAEPHPCLEIAAAGRSDRAAGSGRLVLDGPSRIYVTVQRVVDDHKYWGNYVDVLNPEAVEAFLSQTHDRYRRTFGERLGTDFVSIFTDETFPDWSAIIPREFRDRFGYELEPRLHVIQDEEHPDYVVLTEQLRRVRLELFTESFEKPVQARCREAGLLYSGEKPVLALSQLRFMDIPGCDPGHVKAGEIPDVLGASIRKNARAVYSVERLYDRSSSLCECYHSIGWSATLQDAKLIAESLLVMGTSMLVPHGFFYSTASLRKHDAPPSFFFQMPYWPLTHHLTRWVELIQERFAGTIIDAVVAVFEPSEGVPSDRSLQLYEQVLHGLVGMQVDFLIVDTPMLELLPADISCLVVPPLRRRPQALTDWVSEHAEVHMVDLSEVEWQTQLDDARDWLPSEFPCRVLGGPADRLWTVTRRNEETGQGVWLALNTSRAPLVLRAGAHGLIAESPDDAQEDSLRRGGRGIASGATWELPGLGCVLLREAQEDTVPAQTLRYTLRLDQEYELERGSHNVLRLDRFTMIARTLDGSFVSETARVHAAPLENQLAEAVLAVPARFSFGFGVVPKATMPGLEVTYTALWTVSSDSYPDRPSYVVLEKGCLDGHWSLAVNGAVVEASSFEPGDDPIPNAMMAEVSTLIRVGTNTLTITVMSPGGSDGGLKNPVFIVGDFGVSLARAGDEGGDTIVPQSTRGRFHALDENLMPFYSGTIEYTGGCTIERSPRASREAPPESADGSPAVATLALELPQRFDGSVEVSLNGAPFIAYPWAPHERTVEASWLREGPSEVRIREHTSRERSFDGEWYDPLTGTCKPVDPGAKH